MSLLTVDRLREKAGKPRSHSSPGSQKTAANPSGHPTAGPLLETAGAIAAFLRHERRIDPGERAIIPYPPGLASMNAFIGCLEADALTEGAYKTARQAAAVKQGPEKSSGAVSWYASTGISPATGRRRSIIPAPRDSPASSIVRVPPLSRAV